MLSAKRRQRLLILAFSLAALLTAAACGEGDDATPTSPASQPTNTPSASTTGTVQPTATTGAGGTATTPPGGSTDTVIAAVDNIFNPIGTPQFNAVQSPHMKLGFIEPPFQLQRSASGGLEPEPWLAESWTLAEDQSYVDVDIRSGVMFHKGYGEMTADDWVFSFNNANPRVTEGATNDIGGDLGALFNEATKVDDDTVRLPFNVFQSNWLERYMSSFWEGHVIYSKAVFDEKGAEGMRDVLVGTGPVEVVTYVAAESVVLEKFDDYWGTPSNVETVRVLQVIEPAARKAMLQTGEAHIANLPVKDRVDLIDAGGFALGPEGLLSEQVIAFGGNWWEETHVQTGEPLERTLDLTKPWIGDPADAERMESARMVRHALAMAIDRENLNSGIFLGQGAPGYAPGWPTSLDGFKDEWRWDFNIDEAKSMLADAGYPNGFTIDWWVGPSGDGVQLGEAIGGLWQADLNIQVEFDRTVYGTAFRPSIVNRTVNKIWWCGTDGINFPVTWPKGFLLSSMSDGGFMCGTEHRPFGETFLEMAETTDQGRLMELATGFYDELHRTAAQVGVVDIENFPVYNSNLIASWDMVPEGKGVVGGFNKLHTVEFK